MSYDKDITKIAGSIISLHKDVTDALTGQLSTLQLFNSEEHREHVINIEKHSKIALNVNKTFSVRVAAVNEIVLISEYVVERINSLCAETQQDLQDGQSKVADLLLNK